MNRTEQRLQRAVQARLEPDEHLVAWTQAWVSRYRRFHSLLALRNRDFAVVTDRRLMLWSTGFFTRRPKRRVLADRLDEIAIESTSRDPGRRMACTRAGRPALLLELGKDPQSDRFSIELRDRSLAAKALQRAQSHTTTRSYVKADDETSTTNFATFVGPAAVPSPHDAAAGAAVADALDEPRTAPADEEAAVDEDAETDAEAGTNAEAEVEAEAGTNAEAETEAETEAEAEAGTNAEADPDDGTARAGETSTPPSDLRPWP
jgi:hypothetical protein